MERAESGEFVLATSSARWEHKALEMEVEVIAMGAPTWSVWHWPGSEMIGRATDRVDANDQRGGCGAGNIKYADQVFHRADVEDPGSSIKCPDSKKHEARSPL